MDLTRDDIDKEDVGGDADGVRRELGVNVEHSGNGEEYHSKAAMPDSRPTGGRSRRGPVRRWIRGQIPRVADALIRTLWKTCRVDIQGEANIEALLDAGQAFIPCYWHGHQLFSARALLAVRDRRQDLKLGYLISPSRDGDAAANTFADLDLHVIRGSASRGGAQALREIYQAIRRDGVSPIVNPDGPRGPCHVFKPGVAMLSGLASAPVVPLGYAARPAIQLSSWDKTVLPLPFARVTVVIGQAMEFARGLEGAELEQACERAGAALQAVTAEAQAQIQR